MRLCWFRILPVVACVHEGFSLRINSGQVTDAFEMPLAFLMAPENFKREAAQWNTLPTSVYAISFDGRKGSGMTPGPFMNVQPFASAIALKDNVQEKTNI